MPARAPKPTQDTETRLAALGRRIRGRRKGLGISAVALAEAAGMSRVTLHRIESGEPSVTMGAYMAVLSALGLALEATERRGPAATLPARIRLQDFPELRKLAWQRRRIDELTPKEALALYERNWRHVDPAAMSAEERALVRLLADVLGGGKLLV